MKAAFVSSTGSVPFPSSLSRVLKFFSNAVNVSLVLASPPFSNRFPICASMRENVRSCSTEKRWLSSVLPRLCANVSSSEKACRMMLSTTSFIFWGICSSKSADTLLICASTPAISLMAERIETLVSGAKPDASLVPGVRRILLSLLLCWAGPTGRTPTLAVSIGMASHFLSYSCTSMFRLRAIDLTGSKDRR